MPRTVAGGGRRETYDSFKTALNSAKPDEFPILLVDSEDPLTEESTSAWKHLEERDHWERPAQAHEEQAQLMVTCMETWIMADHAALRTFFGQALNSGRLFPEINLEARTRQEVQRGLEEATRPCGISRMYRKGSRSFQVLTHLNPVILRRYLPHFDRLIKTLLEH